MLTCIRQFDESNEWYAQGAVSCASWLCWRIGLDRGTAREKVRVARALAQLPTIDEALRLGKLSYAKVRALTRVATPANEAQLLELALAATGPEAWSSSSSCSPPTKPTWSCAPSTVHGTLPRKRRPLPPKRRAPPTN